MNIKTLSITVMSVSILLISSSVNAQSLKTKLSGIKGAGKIEYSKEDNGEGISGPLHEKYMGRTVFAKERVKREMPEAKFDTVFTLGEPIYGRAYIQRGIGDYYLTDDQGGKNLNYSGSGVDYSSRAYTMAYVDGVLLMNEPIDVQDLKKNDAGKYLTTFQIFFYKNAEDDGNDKDVIEALNKLSDGAHKVRLETFAGNNPRGRTTKAPIAIGEFTLVKKGSAKIGRSFDQLIPGMKDPALEAKMLKTMQSYGKNNGWKETFSKVKIKSEGWTISRHAVTGIILSRSISAYLYATRPDGKCTYQEFAFKQDHDGTKFMDNTKFDGNGSQVPCDCK
jgi:hypothetical protein